MRNAGFLCVLFLLAAAVDGGVVHEVSPSTASQLGKSVIPLSVPRHRTATRLPLGGAIVTVTGTDLCKPTAQPSPLTPGDIMSVSLAGVEVYSVLDDCVDVTGKVAQGNTQIKVVAGRRLAALAFAVLVELRVGFGCLVPL